jgi:hypothetical protein
MADRRDHACKDIFPVFFPEAVEGGDGKGCDPEILRDCRVEAHQRPINRLMAVHGFNFPDFVRLATWSAEFLFSIYLPATLIALVLIPTGAYWSVRSRLPFPKGGWAWTTLPFLLALVPLLLGTLFWSPTAPNERVSPPTWASYLASSTLLIEFIVTALVLRSAVGWRTYALGVLLLQWLLLLSASFFGGMAMTGDWI